MTDATLKAIGELGQSVFQIAIGLLILLKGFSWANGGKKKGGR